MTQHELVINWRSSMPLPEKRALIIPAFRITSLSTSCKFAETCADQFEMAVPIDFKQVRITVRVTEGRRELR